MSANEIHVDDIGTIFRVTLMDGDVIVDISTATTKQLIFKKSDSTIVTQTAAFTTDGSDGQIQYTTLEDDLDIAGVWRLQAFVIMPTGEWSSDFGPFVVFENL